MTKLFVLLAFFGASVSTLAHEGHDHTPEAVSAPHGGVMKDLEHLYLELSVRQDGVELYPYSHDLKPIALKDVQIEGTVTFPKKSKPEKVSFTAQGESLTAKVDAKGSHRYTLDVTVTYHGKKDKAQFNVEPH